MRRFYPALITCCAAYLVVAGAVVQQSGALEGRRVVLIAGVPGKVFRPGGMVPLLDCNFADSFFWAQGQGILSSCPVTVTRALAKSCQTLSGSWITVAANTPCRTNLGTSSEEARTNSVTNNSMQGAAAGTPGTLPTNWTADQGTCGLANPANINGTGSEAGMDYIEFLLNGSCSTTNSGLVAFENSNPAASSGQTWQTTYFIRIVSGSVGTPGSGGFNTQLNCIGANAGAGAVFYPFSTGVSATYVRGGLIVTCAAGATGIRPLIRIDPGIASQVFTNLVVRIAWPQLELVPASSSGNFATSPIRTTNAAVTRPSDIIAASPAVLNALKANAGWIYASVGRSFANCCGSGAGGSLGYTIGTQTAASPVPFYANGLPIVHNQRTWNTSRNLNCPDGTVNAVTGYSASIVTWDASGTGIVCNGGTMATDANPFAIVTPTTVVYGNEASNAATDPLNAYLKQITIGGPARMPAAVAVPNSKAR